VAQPHCHVRCRGWQQDVVLYRQGRAALPVVASLAAEGEVERPDCDPAGERVEGEGISFTWEIAG
jgi:hypothetical protein